MPRPKPRTDTNTHILETLGLGENEATLYSLMLSQPRSTVQDLCARAPFPRTMFYYLLKKLEEQGLVRAVKDGARAVFLVEDPEHLYDLLAAKEREFARDADAVRELIPLLKSRYRLADARPTVRTFDGIEEYGKALEGVVLSKPKSVFAYEALGVPRAALDTREAYDRKRIARKIPKHVLFFENDASLKALKVRAYDDYTQFRAIDGPAPFSTDVMLYDGKFLYTAAANKNEPTAILIEDRALYEMQKSLFEALWRDGKDRTLAYTEK